MFYGASDQATARAETLDDDNAKHAMASFASGRKIKILDQIIEFHTNHRIITFTFGIFMSIFASGNHRIPSDA